MKYISALIAAFVLAIYATPARSEDQVKFESAAKASEVKPEAKPAEKDLNSIVEEVMATIPPAEQAAIAQFAVIDSDILSWEDNPESSYIFLALTSEKSDELSTLITAHKGQPLQLSIGDNYFFIPAMSNDLAQHQGFVLPVPEERHIEIKMMLNRSKQRNAVTRINFTADPPPASSGETTEITQP